MLTPDAEANTALSQVVRLLTAQMSSLPRRPGTQVVQPSDLVNREILAVLDEVGISMGTEQHTTLALLIASLVATPLTMAGPAFKAAAATGDPEVGVETLRRAFQALGMEQAHADLWDSETERWGLRGDG